MFQSMKTCHDLHNSILLFFFLVRRKDSLFKDIDLIISEECYLNFFNVCKQMPFVSILSSFVFLIKLTGSCVFWGFFFLFQSLCFLCHLLCLEMEESIKIKILLFYAFSFGLLFSLWLSYQPR